LKITPCSFFFLPWKVAVIQTNRELSGIRKFTYKSSTVEDRNDINHDLRIDLSSIRSKKHTNQLAVTLNYRNSQAVE
jgi:hypothetical protein